MNAWPRLRAARPFSPSLAWARALILPLSGILAFLLIWHVAAGRINTSLGQFPDPADTARAAHGLYVEFQEEREKAAAFETRQAERNAARLAENPEAAVSVRAYAGRPTFPDQIRTSLVTVTSGFLLEWIVFSKRATFIGTPGEVFFDRYLLVLNLKSAYRGQKPTTPVMRAIAPST